MKQLRRYRFFPIFCIFLIAVCANFKQSYKFLTTLSDQDVVVFPRADEKHELTLYSHNHTIQTLVLSPDKRYIIAVGTTAFIPCPVPTYANGSLVLRWGTKVYSTTFVQHEELQGGPLVVAYFGVRKDDWIIKVQSTPKSVMLVDKVLDTRYYLPLQVDPNIGGTQHFLSATTTVRKQYRQYNGLGKHVHDGSKTDSWSDAEVSDRLHHWLDFHRRAGVTHFYIVDNESNASKPNLPIVAKSRDITYFRAAHIPYDGWRCYSDEHTPEKTWFTVFGQLVLENSILRLAHTKWLLVGDLDEFFVADDRFDHQLPKLIESYQNISCQGEKSITCTPLLPDMTVFCFNFLPQIMSVNNTRLFEVVYRYKPIVRPDLTSTISVHYSLPRNTSTVTTTIPPRFGFLAHYNKRGGVTGHNWTSLLSNVHNHTKDLRET